MRTYDIDCKCQIVLYGFNNYTQKQISEIKEQGYFCGGIIDRRAHEIKMYQDIPVVSDIRERLIVPFQSCHWIFMLI